MRLGKDSFFLGMMPILYIVSKKTNEVPPYLKLSLIYFAVATFFNQIDFLYPAVFYQHVFIVLGLIFFSWLYENMDKQLISIFKNSMLFLGFVGSFWVFAERLDLKPYKLFCSLFIDNFLYSSTHGKGYVAGMLNHPNMSGAHLALCLPAFLQRKPILAVVPLVAIGLIDSALPVLTACGVVFMYYYAKFLKGHLYLFGLVFVFGIAFYFHGAWGLDNERFLIWGKAFELLKFNKLFGNGPGFFAESFHVLFDPSTNLGKARHEHSEWMWLLLANGLMGLVLVGNILKRAVSCPSPFLISGLFGVFINSYGNHLFHLSTLFVPSIFYVAACLIEGEKRDQTI